MRWIALLVGLAIALCANAITFQGFASNPADTGSKGDSTATAVTPAGGGTAGDLCVLHDDMDSSDGNNASITNTGGQTWNFISNEGVGGPRGEYWWTTFNGTWSANPAVTSHQHLGNSLQTVTLQCFHPTNSTCTWSVDAAASVNGFSAPSTPFDVTVSGQTPTAGASVVTTVYWSSQDDNTYALQTGGWTNPSSVTQTRNTYTPTGHAESVAYLIQLSAAATGNVTNRQATNGGDAGVSMIITFKETCPASGDPFEGPFQGAIR